MEPKNEKKNCPTSGTSYSYKMKFEAERAILEFQKFSPTYNKLKDNNKKKGKWTIN